jgi:hypothetical protein
MAGAVIRNVGSLVRQVSKTGFEIASDINKEVKTTLKDVNNQTGALKADVGETLGETQALQGQLTTPITATGGGKTRKTKTAKTAKKAASNKTRTAAPKKSSRKASDPSSLADNEDIAEKPVSLPGYDANNGSDELHSVYGTENSEPHVHNKNCGCTNCTDKIVVDVGEESSEEEGENYPVIVGAGSRRKTKKKTNKATRRKSRSRSRSKSCGKARTGSRKKLRSKNKK